MAWLVAAALVLVLLAGLCVATEVAFIRVSRTGAWELTRGRKGRPMAGSRALTELEGAVLGTIKQKGPCTPYAVRREFRSSLTPYWSGSAGNVGGWPWRRAL